MRACTFPGKLMRPMKDLTIAAHGGQAVLGVNLRGNIRGGIQGRGAPSRASS